jgi:hypothetical protein
MEARPMDRNCTTEGCEGRRHGLDTTGFCKGCKGATTTKKPATAKPRKAAAKAEPVEDVVYLVPLDFTEARLDRFWATLPIEQKAQAIQAVLDYTQE